MTTNSNSKIMVHQSGVIYRTYGDTWIGSRGKTLIEAVAQRDGRDYGPIRRIQIAKLKEPA